MNLPLLLQFPDIYCDRQTKPNVTGISSAKDNEPKVIGMCLLRSRHSPDISFTVKRSRILTAFTSTQTEPKISGIYFDRSKQSFDIYYDQMERNVTDIHVFRERQISDISFYR